MALQRTRRPRSRSGRSLRALGSPLNARPLDGRMLRQSRVSCLRVRRRIDAARLMLWCGLAFAVSGSLDAALAQTLYGVGFLSNQVELFSINPQTGFMTPLVATGALSLAGGISAFDPVGRRFFFQSDPDLYVVNIGQGTVSHTPLSVPGAFPITEFDPGLQPESIPTLEPLGLLICLVLLAIVGMSLQR